MDCDNVVLINKCTCSFLGRYPEQNKQIHQRKRIHTNSHRVNRSPHIAQKMSKKNAVANRAFNSIKIIYSCPNIAYEMESMPVGVTLGPAVAIASSWLQQALIFLEKETFP